MAIILPIASGKGGVGKSVIAANLGMCLAEAGKTTILVDLDLGCANLHTLLGIKNRFAGLGAIANRSESSVEALVRETGRPRLFFIPGDTLLPGAANLDFFVKQKILKSLARLPADYVLLDLGAGAAANTVDFFLSAAVGAVVTIPETTAVLNAYAFIKTALFRLLLRSFPAKSIERGLIMDFAAKRLEGSSESMATLLQSLAASDAVKTALAAAELERFRPRIIVNMGRSVQDGAICAQLRKMANRNLKLPIGYAAFLPADEAVPRSVAERRPVMTAYPDSPFARSLRAVAARVIAGWPTVAAAPASAANKGPGATGGGPGDEFADLSAVIHEVFPLSWTASRALYL